MGCSPYLQIFKAGKLVFTTAASKSYNQSKDDLPFCLPSDGSISFPVETIVQGDILIRCRHLTRKGQRVSMFRAAFHTGYTPPKVLRLTKAQLDGACSDKRYADEFFIDLIFEECSAAMASKHLISSEKETDTGNHVKFPSDSTKANNDNVQNEAAARRMGATIAGSENNDGVTVTASAYDSMLHRDSRFWDVISERRENNRKRMTSGENIETNNIPFYGPTLGRRREFANEVKSDKSSTEASFQSKEVKSHHSMHSFSIGGDMDFSDNESEPKANEVTSEEISAPKELKKDDLMEALMAIDDDVDAIDGDQLKDDLYEGGSDASSEEIIFDDNSEADRKHSLSEESTEQTDVEEAKETDSTVTSEDQALNSEIESSKSKQSSCDTSLVKVDVQDLDESDSGDFDFEDDDDEELQDLENFLMKTKS